MKIRWGRDSIRLRITPTELEAVRRSESVREVLTFPDGLSWQITLCPSAGETTLASDAEGAYLSLSEADRSRLALPEIEGVYFHSDILKPLRYYVEKDFPCAHPRAAEAQEPVTGTFAAPEGFEQRKQEVMSDAN